MSRQKRNSEDFSDEIKAHIENEAQRLREQGLSEEDARTNAQQTFGNVARAKENFYESRRWLFWDHLRRDIRFALRILRKSPGFTAVAVLTLALGIGANAAIFSWMRTVFLNPLPGASDPERVVAIESVAPSGDPVMTSYLDFTDFRDHLTQFESMSAVQPMSFAVGNDTYVERVWGQLVSGNFFDVLKVQPEAGRFFSGTERDDVQNAHPVAVISHDFWTSRFHASKSAIGQTIRINRHLFTIIGVAPKGFHGSMPGFSFEMWAPATMYGQLSATGDWMLQDRKTRMFRIVARLAPDATILSARQELKALAEIMAKADADTNEGMSAVALPIPDSHWGPQESLRSPLNILLGTGALVMLIVCANVANLILARSTSRRREFGVRLALGASRGRLMWQLLVEALFLAFGGLLLGLLVAAWLRGALQWLLPAASWPSIVQPPIDRGVLLFAVGLAAVVAALTGLAASIQSRTGNLSDALNETVRGGSTGVHSKRLRGVLVTSEIALAMAALVGATVFLKSFYRIKTIQPGFDPQNVAVANFNLSAAGLDARQADAFCRHLRQKLEQHAGVIAASYADYVPLSVNAGSWEDLQIEGYVPLPSENMKIYRTLVAPGFFRLLRIPLLEGRDFTMQDDFTHPPVMIVSREFVRHFIPTGDAIGRKVHGWGKWFTIVGVADDIKVYRLTENPTPYFYVPIRQVYRPEMGLTFYVRTSGLIGQAPGMLRQEAQATDATVPIYDTAALTDYIGQSLFTQKVAASFLAVLSGVACLLATIGLYGVMAYHIVQRTNEIGIRMALGARTRHVLGLVAKQALVLVGPGIVAGYLIAEVLLRFASALLPQVSPSDPLTYAAVAVFSTAIALIASAVPARRAVRLDPIAALRHE